MCHCLFIRANFFVSCFRFFFFLFSFLIFLFCLFFFFCSLLLRSFFFILFPFCPLMSFIFEHCVAAYFAVFLGILLSMFCVRHRFLWRVGWHFLACGIVKRYERWVWMGVVVVVVGTGVAETGASGSAILTARHDSMSSSLCGSGTAVLR